jgi:hypothetical protein
MGDELTCGVLDVLYGIYKGVKKTGKLCDDEKRRLKVSRRFGRDRGILAGEMDPPFLSL